MNTRVPNPTCCNVAEHLCPKCKALNRKANGATAQTRNNKPLTLDELGQLLSDRPRQPVHNVMDLPAEILPDPGTSQAILPGSEPGTNWGTFGVNAAEFRAWADEDRKRNAHAKSPAVSFPVEFQPESSLGFAPVEDDGVARLPSVAQIKAAPYSPDKSMTETYEDGDGEFDDEGDLRPDSDHSIQAELARKRRAPQAQGLQRKMKANVVVTDLLEIPDMDWGPRPTKVG
jgi:hypothetical protein